MELFYFTQILYFISPDGIDNYLYYSNIYIYQSQGTDVFRLRVIKSSCRRLVQQKLRCERPKQRCINSYRYADI